MMRSTHRSQCPDRETWSAFSVGRVDSRAVELLVEHLDGCDSCQAILGAVGTPSDHLLVDLRAIPEPDTDAWEVEPECHRAVQLAQALVATEPHLLRGSANPTTTPIPDRVGEYRIVRALGSGGMGTVFEAVHARIGKRVALKIIRSGRVADAVAIARFHREMAHFSALDHPNIVQATDAGEADGIAFLVMELVDGVDLARLLRGVGPLPVAEACELARQVAVGLQHLASRGLIHRDVKPSNLMLGREGTVRLLDLGLAIAAREVRDPDGLTETGIVVGTVDYLAPEQADHDAPVDARTDVYALGCTLFHLLTGKPPYPGAEYPTVRAKLLAHVSAPVPSVRTVRPEVPTDMAALLARMMAKEPAERFATPAQVAEALARFTEGSDLPRLLARFDGAEPIPPNVVLPALPEKPRRQRRTHVAILAVAAMVLAVGLFAAVSIADWPDRRIAQPTTPHLTIPTTPRVEVPKPVPRIVPIAVLRFEERDKSVAGLGESVADLLFAKLSTQANLVLVERANLQKSLDELQLNLSGAAKPGEATRVGQITGAKILVTGSVISTGGKVTIVAKLIGTETSRVFGTSENGPANGDWDVLVTSLAENIVALLAKETEQLVPRPSTPVDHVAAIREMLKNQPRPTVAVFVTESTTASAPDSVQRELMRFLRETGFEILDADDGESSRADVIVTGTAIAEPTIRRDKLVSAKARVDLNAVERMSGRVLAVDRQTGFAVDLTDSAATSAARDAAIAPLVQRFLPRLVGGAHTRKDP